MTRIIAFSFSILWLIGAFVSASTVALAQSDQSNVRYTQGGVNDSAQMSLGVPLGNYKGRGVDLPISLNYSADVWKIEYMNSVQTLVSGWSCCFTHSVAEASYSKDSIAGWKSSLELPVVEWPKSTTGYDYHGKPYAPLSGGAGCFNYRIAEVYIHMPDGSNHTLRKSDQPYNNPNAVDMSGNFYAIDDSRIRFYATGVDTGTIYMPDGTRYVLETSSATVVDKSGNFITFDKAHGIWTDTIGREIYDPIPANPQVGDYQYTLPGLSGNMTYTFKWRNLENALTPDDQGHMPTLRVIGSEYLPNPSSTPTNYNGGNYPVAQTNQNRLFQSIAPQEDPNNPGVPRLPTLIVGHNQASGALFNPVVLTEIDLPDNTSYRFTYNVYGEIDKVIYPTNAYETYQHAGYPVASSPWDEVNGDIQPYAQGMRWITDRKQSASSDGSDAVEWTYTNAPNLDGGGTTTIVAPDGTMTSITRFDAGPKHFGGTQQNQAYYYQFGDKDPRVGMVASKVFYSKPGQGGTRSMLKRELYQYSAHDSYSTEYSIGCQLGQSWITQQFPMRRAARLTRQTNIVFEGTGSALAESQIFDYDVSHEMNTGLDQVYSAVYAFVVLDHNTAETVTDISTIPLGTRLKYTQNEYSQDEGYRSANILGLPTKVTIRNNSDQVVSRNTMAFDDKDYVPGTHNALPTTIGTWDSTKGSDPDNPAAYLYTHATFDEYGNRTIATDAKGNPMTTTFDSTYHCYPVSVTSAVPEDSGTHSSSTAFTFYTTFDTVTGLVLSRTDINGQNTTMEYNDPLLRTTRVIAPNGAQTITEYGVGTSDSTRWVRVRSQVDSDHWSEGKTFYDGLGRTNRTQKTDTVDPAGDIFTLTCYDSMGRVAKTSNPFRNLTSQSCSTSTLEWTKPEYDDLSRAIKVTSPDPTSTPTTIQVTYGLSTTGVIGTTKLLTDQAGKTRMGLSDALGNMVRVIEDSGDGSHNNFTTDYTFDTLGNLRKTTQGAQIRYFNYDSLGRVLRAKQVEQTVNSNLALASADSITGNNSWTVGYTYDDNSNIVATTDAKNVTITATYDRLNRLMTRTYNDSPLTPAVDFYYDGKGLPSTPSVANGKTTRVTSAVSDTRNTSFDSMGHTLTSQQITDGRTFDFSYAYNLGGALIEETYPSGRVVRNTLNANGELEQVQSRKNGNQGYWAYANNFSYNAAGVVAKMQLGNGHWETTNYNERQQVTMISLGTTNDQQNLLKLEFGYTTSPTSNDNNGSLRSQKITVPAIGQNPQFVADQVYSYDDLNRIHDAAETVEGVSGNTWKQTFQYDRYGNRSFDANNTTTIPQDCSAAICNPSFSPTTNRISSNGYTYDLNGAITQNAANERFGYDAESRQTAFFNANNGGSTPDATYAYDGLAHRVKKVNGTEVTIFVYDAGGQLSAEYSTTVASTQDARVNYVTADHLGSPRINTDASGAVISRKDFTAFGENVAWGPRTSGQYGNGYDLPNIRQDYTGYEKDSESKLEYAQARYYNPAHGRFTSVDPFPGSGALRDPQTLNRYSYSLNSPYKFTDPLGLFPAGGAGCVESHRCITNGSDSNWWSGNAPFIIDLYYTATRITTYRTTAEDGNRKADITTTITEQRVVVDQAGNVLVPDPSPLVASNARSVGSNPIAPPELRSIENIVTTAVTLALASNFSVSILLAILKTETQYGILPNHEGAKNKVSTINPGQFSASSGLGRAVSEDDGYTTQGALEYNIGKVMEKWNHSSVQKGKDLNEMFQLYNNEAGKKVAYAAKAEANYRSIRATGPITTRTGRFWSTEPPSSIPMSVTPCATRFSCR